MLGTWVNVAGEDLISCSYLRPLPSVADCIIGQPPTGLKVKRLSIVLQFRYETKRPPQLGWGPVEGVKPPDDHTPVPAFQVVRAVGLRPRRRCVSQALSTHPLSIG